MTVSRSAKVETTSSNSIASVRGQAHLRPTTFGIVGEPLDQAERNRRARPERVVDDDADVGGGRRFRNVFVEILLGVLEIEGAGHLDEFGAEPLRRLGELPQLAASRSTAPPWRRGCGRPPPRSPPRPPQSARRRSWSRSRPRRRRPGAWRCRASMPRSIRKATARRVAARSTAEIGVAEHRRDGDVAAFQPLSRAVPVHLASPSTALRRPMQIMIGSHPCPLDEARRKLGR